MPASIDLGGYPLVTHSPVERLDQTLPKMPKMDLEKLFREFIDGLKDLTGIDLSILNDFVHGLGSGLDGLRRFVESLIGQALDMLHLPDPSTVWRQIMGAFLNPLSWLSNIPIGAITAAAPNLLADFLAEDSLVGESMWVFDSAVRPAGVAGSVRSTADGTIHELISERIQLDVGRKVTASVKIKYAGMTAPIGSPIRLSWIGWNGDAEVAGGDFAVHQPSGPALDWTTLDGFLTRQAADTWDRVSIRLTVMAGATAGNVWFAVPSATKPDKLPQSLVDGLAQSLAVAGQTIRDAICNALGMGGTGHTDADVINALTNIPRQAIAGLEGIVNNFTAGFKNFFDGWFGGNHGTGSAAEVRQTVEAIKDAVLNGWNVHVVTASEANWPVPPHTECELILIGGGQNGGAGGNGGVQQYGGAAGLNGSYLAQQLNLTGVTALDFAIGTAGNKTFVRVANTTTPHSGAVLAASPDHGTAGGIAGPLGYTATTSTPGNGGRGEGFGNGHQPAELGESTAVAAGGTRGGNNGLYGTPGGPGGSVSAGAPTKCGGAGGGGGGSAAFAGNTGGGGGAGGYPGGAGGGGGCGSSGAAGGGGGPGSIGLAVIRTRG
ncbi:MULTISPECIES: hypothetical protein [unclassified Mycolicibacterium]|uniref:hypothetical protein n=1 Tax=unclassified Mycolicibacterium TaxID=2636767 RepID=UPI00192E50CE|nr:MULTISPECIES: hypothetical protein [unclassified Mycolicibacterium]MUM08714.1 hypothetical protein [Mycolicibacterium sp. CBMA 213]